MEGVQMNNTPRTDAEAFLPHDSKYRVCDADFVRQLERELNAAQQRIKRLRDGIAKQNLEIEQTCGKVLDYPWFKDDQKNFPGATEKDGVCVGDHVAETIAAELARKYTDAKQRIKRLEEAGDALEYASVILEAGEDPNGFAKLLIAQRAWRKAKEAKP